MAQRVLILFSHPYAEASRVNRALVSAVVDMPDVTVHDLYEHYPEQMIDVAHEQALVAEHDVLVFQHPLFWYSCPSLMKNWLDTVLTFGWAYGDDGDALRGKPWIHAITSGGAANVYQRMAYNQFSIAELLRPFEQTATLCGMPYLQPFLTQDVNQLDEIALQKRAAQYAQWIQGLVDGDLPPVVHTAHAPQVDFLAGA